MNGRVKLTAIQDVNDRMTTYKKRKETLLRKMEEITTLCGVECSLIMFSELEGGGGLTWPANREAVQGVVEKVKLDIRKNEQDMNSWTEATVAKERLSQARLELSIEDKEATLLMSERFLGRKSVKDLSADEMRRLKHVIEEKQRNVRTRIRNLTKPENEDNEDPDMYLNLHSPDNANHGMNMTGDDPNVAGTTWMGNGRQDQAGPSGAGMSSWDSVGTRDGGRL